MNEYILRKSYTFKKVKFKKSEPCKPFHQLLMVLPPQSSYLLPNKMKYLTTSKDSKLVKKGLYPTKVVFDYINKEKQWMGIPKLPEIDYNFISKIYFAVEKGMIDKSQVEGKEAASLRNDLIRNELFTNFVFKKGD